MTETLPNHRTNSKTQPVAKLSEVYKIFKQGQNEVMALKNISLNIYPGELIVIMGPSGSGKTTLLHVLAGISRPSSGTILVNDLEVNRLKDAGIQDLLQNHIGIVFQFFNLIPTLSAAGNIEMPMIVAKVPKKERQERVEALLKEVGMEDRAKHRPFALSGGEKQRIAIAQAFANDPDIIIADEPTGNVDSISAEKIMQYFKKALADNPDKAMVIVTHDSAFRKIADRTMILKDGEIVKEYGRLAQDENEDDIEVKEETSISKITRKQKEAHFIINGPQNYPLYSDISQCPNCQSTNIIKNYDREAGAMYNHNQQIVSRISVACLECHKITYEFGGIFNLKHDMHNPN
ncbi:Vitamin B12 import ATP-binding protein BtuD [Candidatus Lokiarchaeum ossiferum]|uniref:Vitamin B12 import ATP-binding protein BtuD n=1 Tax=Candidatus Lokiarchaeum ossiferum TaxID=2951803 RepID=A0ABY6HMN1_9ARCH|nr:Vitamin B12 import ATP-binding protein BtuD [Candidatus Lokiarchaeum sp. B-35]